MSTLKTSGIILKKIDFLEKDIIVTLFTKHLSKISAIGISAKKSIKRKLNLLDYGNFLEITLLKRKNYPLYIIQNVEIIEKLLPPTNTYLYLNIFQLCNEIINSIIYGGEDSEHLFNFFVSFLKNLKVSKNNYLSNIAIFKLLILEKIGLKLDNKKCITCGKDGNFLKYSIEKCGFVCNRCDKKTVKINMGTVKTIEYIETGKTNIKLTREILNDINKIFFINLTHLRSPDNVKRIIKLENTLKWILKN